MSTSCIEPKGNTLSLENPCKMGADGFQFCPSVVHLVEGRGEDDVN